MKTTARTSLLLLALAFLLEACCCPSQEELAEIKRKNEEKLANDKKEIKEYYKLLAKVKKAVPAAEELNLKKCDDAKIVALRKKHKAIGQRLLTVDYEFLALLTAKEFDPARRDALKEWEWVRSRELVNLRHPDDIPDSTIARFVQEDIEKARKLPLFGVFRATERRMPDVPKGADTFTAGFYDGFIVVVDLNGKALCQAPFSAENSKEVGYSKGKILSDDYKAGEAIKDDFLDNFEKATNIALKEISKELEVNLGIFQL